MRFIRVFTLLMLCAAINSAMADESEIAAVRSLQGKVVYLDFWASWCAPCRQSFPWMNEIQKRYADRGLTIIAVNLDHDRADAQRFLQKLTPGFQIRFDPAGDWAHHFAVHGMPTSVLLDRTGKPRFTHIGFRNADAAQYEQQIQQLLSER
jgi:cytochrome c biogenesis protein CcmG/thiol:disulfide interchange protein DsbE